MRAKWILLSVVVLCLAMNAAAQRRFYITPDNHTDYFWNADDAAYRSIHNNEIDYFLGKMDATAANPSDFQMRYQCDGSLWMWDYEHSRTASQFNRLTDRIRDGHLSVALNPLVLVQGGSPAEAVLRGMYYPGIIERRANVHFPVAISMENQTQPFGLASLWAGSGAKWSWKGVCNCATHVSNLGSRDREIYYATGRDGSRILMKWMSQWAFNTNNFGGYSEAYAPMTAINFAESRTDFQAKWPWAAIGAFGKAGDDLEYQSDEFVTIAQQNTTPGRRIIVSNTEDFFQDFEANYGSQMENYGASFGNEWDVLVASMPEVSARFKRSVEKLRGAEAMATLVSLNDSNFMTSRTAARDKAMLDMGLYFEHDWTADGPVSRTARANWSRSVEAEVTSYVDSLYDDARNALASQISRAGTEQRFYVFNPLSWTRTDFADVPLRFTGTVRVIDLSTGAEVPSQVVNLGTRRMLRVMAANVPSAGYKVFEIRHGAGQTVPTMVTATGGTVENSFYKLTVAPDGAITSLIDKPHGNRETVRAIGGRVLNDLGGNRTGTVTVENAGAVSVTLRASSASPVQHTTRITLYRDSDRVDVDNEIMQNFGDVKTWSYSFDLASPDVWHEEVGAVIRGKLLANGGHYSPHNARYDWLTMNHFADISDGSGSFGVTVSNWDDYFMKLGSSTDASLDTATPQINVLAGGQVDGPTLGIPNNGGDSYFRQRFALRTHAAFDQTASMKMSLEHQNPFITGWIAGSGTQTRAYPAASYSFLTISDPNILLWALKPAEDGIARGVVARVWNQGNSPASYSVSFARPVAAAERLTHIETTVGPANVTAGQLTANINQQQLQTHLVKFQ